MYRSNKSKKRAGRKQFNLTRNSHTKQRRDTKTGEIVASADEVRALKLVLGVTAKEAKLHASKRKEFDQPKKKKGGGCKK